MDMKTNRLINVLGALIATCLVVSLSVAQEKIADDDLLKILENANAGSFEKPEDAVEQSNPVDSTVESVQEAEERIEEAEVVMEEDSVEDETAPVEAAEEVAEAADTSPAEEEMIDDLGMVSYDEDAASSDEELISVRLNRVGLEEAINLFAQLSGANIIVPELAEAAQISVNLKDVEWRPALQSILDSYNYELYQKVSGSNVFSVRRRPAGAPEPQVVETFTLRYATVPNAAALVRELLPEDAKISEFASRNMLVVKSTESSLGEVRSVLASIDTVRQQVFIESKFMELSDGAQKDLGIDWQMLQGYQAGAQNLSSSSTDTRDENNTDRRMYDLNGNPLLELSEPTFVDDGVGGAERYQTEGATKTKILTDTITRTTTAVLSADDLSLVLSALEESRGVNMVSNPKIIVANEEKANIAIIRKEPNLKQSREASVNNNAHSCRNRVSTAARGATRHP